MSQNVQEFIAHWEQNLKEEEQKALLEELGLYTDEKEYLDESQKMDSWEAREKGFIRDTDGDDKRWYKVVRHYPQISYDEYARLKSIQGRMRQASSTKVIYAEMGDDGSESRSELLLRVTAVIIGITGLIASMVLATMEITGIAFLAFLGTLLSVVLLSCEWQVIGYIRKAAGPIRGTITVGALPTRDGKKPPEA